VARPAVLSILVAVCCALPLAAQIPLAPITRPSFQPHAVAVYEGGNRLFVADDVSGNIFTYDGTTHAELASTFVGAGMQDMAVHEASAKLYAIQSASNQLVVLDAMTGAFLRFVSGAYSGFAEILVDQTLNKVWVRSDEGLRQIDVATNVATMVPGVNGEDMDLNAITHELFVATYIPAKLYGVNGTTLAVTLLLENYPALGIAVNWQENRVYLSSGTAASIVSYDRDTATTQYVAENDAATMLVYDPVRNRTISGAEVNSRSTIIEGNDSSFNLPMESGSAWLGIRHATGHVYYVAEDHVTVLDQATHVVQRFPIPNDTQPGGFADIAINQTTGRVYIVADAAEDFVTVFQDTEKLQRPPLFLGTSFGFWMRMIDPQTMQVVESYNGDHARGLHLRPGGGRLYTRGLSVHDSVHVFAGTGVDEQVDTLGPLDSGLAAIATSPDGATLYVSRPGNVLVVDVATHTTLATVEVGLEPRALAVTPDGAKLFVANRGSDSVSVIATATRSVIGLAPAGDRPSAIAMHPAGRKVYVRNESGSVSVIDVATHVVLATIPVGGGAGSLALSADGKRVYVSNETGSTVSVIDTGTHAVVATLPITAGTPRGVAARPDGTAMYVVAKTADPSSIVTIDTATLAMQVTPIVTSEFGGTGEADELVATDPFARFAGRVTTPGGTVVSGAIVRAMQGGIERGTMTTNAAGDYAIPALVAGTYDVELSKGGVVTTVATQVAIAGRITLVDATVAPCSVELTPAFASHASSAGTTTIAVSAAPGCEWTAIASGFLSISGSASGSGNGSVAIAVAANGNPGARVATVTIAAASATITQNGSGASSLQLDAVAGSSHVQLAWTSSAGATSYEITRSAAGGPFVSLSTTPFATFTDHGVASGTGYLYRVLAHAAGVIAYSNVDLAVVINTDLLVTRSTPIRAAHVVQLRQAVNAGRAAIARVPLAFVDPAPAGIAVKRMHVLELRSAIDALRAAIGLAPIPWTDGTLTAGVSIVRAAHLVEARDALH
jgi:YVTN family beta-propeller protein